MRSARGWPNPLATGCPPAWASTWGHDKFGVFVGFSLGREDHVLRWVGPGTFTMGSPETEEGRYGDEGPQHEALLEEGLWVGETTVTQGLWEDVMGDNPSAFKLGRNYPVEQVSWEDCQAFLARINARIPGLAVRLPHEAEWEYACRAGTAGARYGELDRIAWHQGSSDRKTHPVKQKEPNAWGLYDMLGNVWEWCQDGWYDYSSVLQRGPVPATHQGEHRVYRGGSWINVARFVRAADRHAIPPGACFSYLGFRIVRGQG